MRLRGLDGGLGARQYARGQALHVINVLSRQPPCVVAHSQPATRQSGAPLQLDGVCPWQQPPPPAVAEQDACALPFIDTIAEWPQGDTGNLSGDIIELVIPLQTSLCPEGANWPPTCWYSNTKNACRRLQVLG